MSTQTEQVTTECLDKARADAEAAQDALKAAITAGRSSAPGPTEVTRLGQLSEVAARTAVRAQQMTNAAAEQEQRLADRRAAEAAAGPALDRISGDLTASRAGLSTAVDKAQAAMVAALAAAQRHDALVAAHRAELVALGLGGVAGAEHDTDAPGRAGVRVRGAWYGPVDPDGVLHRVVINVAGSVLPQGGVVMQRLGRHSQPLSVLERSGVLADCAPVAPNEKAARTPAIPAQWPPPAEAVPARRRR